MTIPNYASTTDFALILPNADSTLLNTVISQVSRGIEIACGRVFYTTTADTRYFDLQRDRVNYLLYTTPQPMLPPDTVPIDDLLFSGDEAVTLDGELIPEINYEFLPLNDTVKTSIKLHNNYGDRVGITGTFGYCATTPDGIKCACIMLSRLTYQAMTERQLKNERNGNYSVAYADTECYPDAELYNKYLAHYRTGKIA